MNVCLKVKHLTDIHFEALLRGRTEAKILSARQKDRTQVTYWRAWCMCPLHQLSRHSRQSLKSHRPEIS